MVEGIRTALCWLSLFFFLIGLGLWSDKMRLDRENDQLRREYMVLSADCSCHKGRPIHVNKRK